MLNWFKRRRNDVTSYETNEEWIQALSHPADGKAIKHNAKVITLQSDDLSDYNNFENPSTIHPIESDLKIKRNGANLSLKPYSFTILTFQNK